MLDITELENQERDSGFFSFHKTYVSKVDVPLYFENCTFDDVIAYKYNDFSKTMYKADFLSSVIFKNCVFKGKTEFKHSVFYKEINFDGSSFDNEANFKHAVIKKTANFKNSDFFEEANFKHTVVNITFTHIPYLTCRA